MVAERAARDAGVMDGNYGGTLDLRLAACDTVILRDALVMERPKR